MNTEVPQVPSELSPHPFEKALMELINKHSMENDSDTPDFILAEYMANCLWVYNKTVKARDKWFGIDAWSNFTDLPSI